MDDKLYLQSSVFNLFIYCIEKFPTKCYHSNFALTLNFRTKIKHQLVTYDITMGIYYERTGRIFRILR